MHLNRILIQVNPEERFASINNWTIIA